MKRCRQLKTSLTMDSHCGWMVVTCRRQHDAARLVLALALNFPRGAKYPKRNPVKITDTDESRMRKGGVMKTRLRHTFLCQ